MVIALLALGLVMILGGIAAVVQGFPYVRLESGLAMVIGGTTAASAGAVTLGLAAIVLRLKRLESSMSALRYSAPAVPIPHDGSPVTIESPVVASPLAATGRVGSAVGEQVARFEPEPDLPPAPRVELAAPSAPSVEPWIPEPQSRSEPSPAPLVEDAEPSAQSPNFLERAAGSEADLSLRPSLDAAEETPETSLTVSADLAEVGTSKPDAPQSDPVKTEPLEHDHAPGPELEVIGTYSSGGNTYVMFADGTIEADTPRGRFNFNSLEELKDFVDSGGEHETRGAA